MTVWKEFLKFLDDRINFFGAQYRTLGIVGILNYLSAYLIFYYLGILENSILRLIGLLLLFPLVFVKYWPTEVKKYLNLYWFLALLYCFPFFGTYMILENHVSIGWLMNIFTGFFWLILLTDWMIFVILMPFGILLGYLAFLASGQEIIIESSFEQISLAACLYVYTIIIGLLFSRSHERSHQDKLNTMKVLAGSIAHELRTPLSAMMMGVQNLGRFLPLYREGYDQAREANLPIPKITPREEQYLSKLPENLYTVSQNAHTMITMLLTNLSNGRAEKKLEPCSMAHCVREALETYPLSEDERTLIHWEDSEDAAKNFNFLGHKEMMKHVLFNLLKNALYAMAAVGKGEVFITVKPAGNGRGKKFNQLVFKDTGPGMPPEVLRHIFDRFYTRTEHGSGIGLAFCQSVLQSFGGEITCDSEQGKHTTFTISLPVEKP
jgi:signal transduction histidine kinase